MPPAMHSRAAIEPVFGLDNTAAIPRATNATTAAIAKTRCDDQSRPTSAPSVRITTTTLVTASGLSAWPTIEMILWAIVPGVSAMTVSPRATAGDARSAKIPARSSVIDSPAAVASKPFSVGD
ncbi:MAG TPA: hypothetical protein VFC57_04725 [Aeromicrobium sp.]|nr:hypothetical protein [Aeromicrobium sp.]